MKTNDLEFKAKYWGYKKANDSECAAKEKTRYSAYQGHHQTAKVKVDENHIS